jgi:ArsR family metal-binding transcriptional regulator
MKPCPFKAGREQVEVDMVTKIVVPIPPQSSMNRERRVSALLKMQVLHLHEAERRLPVRHHTDIYINAIKTEGEAAEYIRRVTEAIREAHEAAAERRARPVVKRRGGIDIAAVADEGAERKRRRKKGNGRSKS